VAGPLHAEFVRQHNKAPQAVDPMGLLRRLDGLAQGMRRPVPQGLPKPLRELAQGLPLPLSQGQPTRKVATSKV
jgi:hypothetical protein